MTARKEGFFLSCFVSFVWMDEVPLKKECKKLKKGQFLNHFTHTLK